MIIKLLEEATSTEKFTSFVLIIISSCKTTSKCTKLSLTKELIKERLFASYHPPLLLSLDVSLFLRHYGLKLFYSQLSIGGISNTKTM